MKIFFSMRHSDTIRNFESVIRSLAEREHQFHLSFLMRGRIGDDRMAVGDERIITRVSREIPATSYSWRQKSSDVHWGTFARAVRSLIDVLRYRLPDYKNSPKLRERAEQRLPWGLRVVSKLPLLGWRPLNRMATRCLVRVDRAIPVDASIEEEVLAENPDLMLLTPLVDFGSDQVDYVKVAQRHGIHCALCVHSWDNLTNKGLIRLIPERIYVWNEMQRREAIEQHGARPSGVVVTGATTYEHWFDWQPGSSAEEFKRQVGLQSSQPYVLYLCSSSFIAPTEVEFIDRWIDSVRGSDASALKNVGVLVRPHPQNVQPWERLDLSAPPQVAIWPARGANPVHRDAKRDYYDSMYHSAAVVGINTSGMIEAGILGRRVLTILDADYGATQEGTLHFRHLVNVGDGLLQVARSFDNHLEQLAGVLSADEPGSGQGSDFVKEFIRPLGDDVSPTKVFVEDVEELAARDAPDPQPLTIGSRALRLAVAPLSAIAHLHQKLAHRRRKFERKYHSAWGYLVSSLRKMLLRRLLSILKRRRVRGFVRRHVVPRVVSGDTAVQHGESVKREIRRLAGTGGKPIVVGPWLGEVGFELLYWIPFLNWVRSNEGLDRDRLFVISRGGAANWYESVTDNYIEILDYMTSEHYLYNNSRRMQGGKQKQRKTSDFGREILQIAKDVLKEHDFEILHPAMMYNLFMLYWKRQASVRLAEQFSEFKRFGTVKPSAWAADLPDDYIAARFYFNDSFPDTEENRGFVEGMLANLTERHDVVVLNPGFAMDDHWDFDPKRSARLHAIDHLMEPSNNLGVQTEVISRARAFVGTYGGLSYLAPFYGVDSIALYSHGAGFHYHHLEFANKVFVEMDEAAFMAIDVRDTSLIRLVMNGKRFPTVRGRRSLPPRQKAVMGDGPS